jgi:Domain of unknown function (DUF4453)/YARHG domain
MSRLVILLFALLASPVWALDNCDEWWFTRNLIFDRAGYCFASPLGQAIFDNEGCVPGDPKLDRDTLNIVAGIQALEQQWECKVDTQRRNLNIPNLQARLALGDIPVPDEYESGCMGWRGAEIALRDRRSDAAPVTGRIEPGADIYYGFVQLDGWDFVLSQGNVMGWMRRVPFDANSCATNAG